MAFKLWNSASNDWSWAGSFDPSGVPVSNDDVTIPKTTTVAPTQGMSQGAVDLDSLRIEPGCMYPIGSESDPLEIAADLIVHQGWGTLWLSTRTSPFVDQLVIDSQNWDNACTVGLAAGGAGTKSFTRVSLLRGKLIAGSSVPTILGFEIGYRNIPQGDAIADFSNGMVVADLHVNAGIVSINNTNGGFDFDVTQSGGRIQFVEANAIKVRKLTQSGGSLDMRGYPAAGTDLVTTLVMMGGVQTWLNDPRPKTIASALIMPGASLLLPSSVTITSGGSMVTPPIAA